MTFYPVSKRATCQKSFCVTGAILLHRFQKKTFILRGRRSTVDVWCCVFLRSALSGLRQVVTTCKLCCKRGIVRVSFCVAGAAFGADPLCVECHFAWQAQYLGHSTLHTLHTLQYLHYLRYLHFTLDTPHSTLYSRHLGAWACCSGL